MADKGFNPIRSVRRAADFVGRITDIPSNPLTYAFLPATPGAFALSTSGAVTQSLLGPSGGDGAAPVAPVAGNPPTIEGSAEQIGEGEGGGIDMAEFYDMLLGSMADIQAQNRAEIGPFMDQMRSQAGTTASWMDSATQKAYADLGITPEEILGGMAMARANAQSLMAGELPQQYIDQMRSYRAEQFPSYVTGSPDMYGKADMRAYGFDVMSAMLRGTEMYPQLAGQTMQLGQQFIPGTMNLGNIYSQNMSTMAPYYFTQPSALLGPITQGYTTGAQLDNSLAIANLQAQTSWNEMQTQLQYSNYWNQQNLQMEQYRMQVEAQARRDAERASGINNLITGGLGIITAAVTGNPFAALPTLSNSFPYGQFY